MLAGVAATPFAHAHSREKLKRAAALALTSNLEDAPAAARVSVLLRGSGDRLEFVSAAEQRHRFTFGGGQARRVSGGLVFPVASIAPSNLGNLRGVLPGDPDLQAWGWSAAWRTTSDRVEIRVQASAAHYFRIAVNGRYVSKTPVRYPVSGLNRICIDFGSDVDRVIRFEGNVQGQFCGVAVRPGVAVSALQSAGVVAFCAGDSFTEGMGATQPGSLAWCSVMGRLLGWSDIRQVAVGATGYLNTGPGRSRFRDQIPRWATNSDVTPDVITIAHGHNDRGLNPAEVAAEAAGGVREIRRRYPGAVVYVFGPWLGVSGADQIARDMEAAIFRQVSPLGARTIAVAGAATPWRWTMSADRVHPDDMGHESIGRRAAVEVRRNLGLT